MALSKTKRNRMYKLARQAKRDRLNDSAPRKRDIRHGKRVASKIDAQREYTSARGYEAILAFRDYGPVFALKAADFNRGKDRY